MGYLTDSLSLTDRWWNESFTWSATGLRGLPHRSPVARTTKVDWRLSVITQRHHSCCEISIWGNTVFWELFVFRLWFKPLKQLALGVWKAPVSLDGTVTISSWSVLMWHSGAQPQSRFTFESMCWEVKSTWLVAEQPCWAGVETCLQQDLC